ncbi:endonuclease domain-containing protein [Acaryochloris sp. 'Moss Beach']|uniref:endonuclease domain-containing protein n=1 Tax=Acaryochloris sp. 'Moss Beach' TaxID=2740837 RepID=UPI001F282DB0|nr:endonuclease domain-containing protein [Acaryochloris sp. 'Moss Beach']UJB71416.1 endonuclease domain-containing protein [Acaryochloris sp. 'Moss Beach']
MREKPTQHHRIRGTTPAVVAAARRLRLNLTPAEQKLWKALQKRQLSGLKFRCQHAIGLFIVDFYCPQCRLVIELDGDIHNQQVEYDQARTEQLNQLGYRVIRFHNSDVMHHLDHVLQQIRYASEQSIDRQSKSPRMGDLGG